MIALAAAASAAEQPPTAFCDPVNEAIRTQVRAIRAIALAPDGKQVLAEISDPTALGGRSHLWRLAPAAPPRQLTRSKTADEDGEVSGVWSPDPRSITYLSKSGAITALVRQPVTGTPPMPAMYAHEAVIDGVIHLTWLSERPAADGGAASVKGFAYSPDGKFMAVWHAARPPASRAPQDPKNDAYIYGADAGGDILLIFNTLTGASTRRIVPGGSIEHLQWSADSAALLVAAQTVLPGTGPHTAVWSVDAQTAVATLVDLPGDVVQAAYGPARKSIVFTAQCSDDTPSQLCQDLFVKTLDGHPIVNLSRGFPGALPGSFFTLANGDVIMMAARGWQTRVARISLPNGALTWIDVGLPAVTAVATNPAQTGWAIAGSAATNPGSVMWLASLGRKPVPLAMPSLAPTAWPKVASEPVSWISQGFKIHGLLYRPQGETTGKIPLIVHIHGGPGWRFDDAYSPLVQLLVAQGWAVLQPNIRGSTGYGPTFLAANKDDLGGKDFLDVMAGVASVVSTYPIDTSRLALIGYSYGGEMASFAAGKTTIFKALVAGAPVTDQISEFGTEAWPYGDRWYYKWPIARLADAWRQSPLAYAVNAKTPLLLLQGKEDTSDPLGQSLEMWRALKIHGTPVELVIYPREDHPSLYYNFVGAPSREPWHGFDLRQRMIDFIRNAFSDVNDPFGPATAELSGSNASGPCHLRR